MLRVKNKGSYEGVPKYQAWTPEKYADLVAITTAGEAEGAANISEAGELGTRLIKWNTTGKGASFYASIGDLRCAAVDGQIASLEEGGTTIGDKHFPYWRDLLPGPYNTCHPNCRHRFAPYLEEAVGYDEAQKNKESARTPRIIQAERDAEAYGVKKADFGSDKHVHIAESVNRVLKGMVDDGQPVPRKITFEKRRGQADIPASFRRNRISGQPGEIFVNTASPFWDNLAANMQEAAATRQFSSANIDHVIHHEMGHFLHNTNLKNELYQIFKDRDLTVDEIRLIIKEVSEYAAETPLEFVAETYAGMKAGKKYSPALMALYNSFGGPI